MDTLTNFGIGSFLPVTICARRIECLEEIDYAVDTVIILFKR